MKTKWYEHIGLSSNSLTLACQAALRVALMSAGLQLVVFIALSVAWFGASYWAIGSYIFSCIKRLDMPNTAILSTYGFALLKENIRLFLLSCLTYILAVPLLMRISKRHGRDITETKYVRGVKLLDEDGLALEIRDAGIKSTIKLTPKIAIPEYIETQGFGVVGAMGTGKTQSIMAIAKGLKARGTRAIFNDVKGDYYSILGTADDLLFCPLDERHMRGFGGWSLFSSIRTVYDIETIAAALIPDMPNAKDPYWYLAPRQLFASILRYCHHTGQTKNSDIWRIVSLPLGSLASVLQGVPGCEKGYQYIKDPKIKSASDVKSILMSYCQALEYMADTDGNFSIEEWLESGKGNIYILNYPQIKDALKPILTLFIDLLIKRLLSMPADLHRRISFILDEITQLGKLNSIIDLQTLSRDRGACNIIGYQTNSTLHRIYGRDDATTILGNLKSKIVCGLADPETADYYERYFGKVEELRTLRSHTVKTGDQNDGVSFPEQFHKRPIVTADDLLHGLSVTPSHYECYVKLANFPPARLKMKVVPYQSIQDAFRPKPGVSLDFIKQRAEELQSDVVKIIEEKEETQEGLQLDDYNEFA